MRIATAGFSPVCVSVSVTGPDAVLDELTVESKTRLASEDERRPVVHAVKPDAALVVGIGASAAGSIAGLEHDGAGDRVSDAIDDAPGDGAEPPRPAQGDRDLAGLAGLDGDVLLEQLVVPPAVARQEGEPELPHGQRRDLEPPRVVDRGLGMALRVEAHAVRPVERGGDLDHKAAGPAGITALDVAGEPPDRGQPGGPGPILRGGQQHGLFAELGRFDANEIDRVGQQVRQLDHPAGVGPRGDPVDDLPRDRQGVEDALVPRCRHADRMVDPADASPLHRPAGRVEHLHGRRPGRPEHQRDRRAGKRHSLDSIRRPAR